MAFKILSLDGGGSWALVQARVLQDMYPGMGGHEILKKFDLAIANSGGSLVLACLCNDMTPEAIADVFKDQQKRQQVFSAMTFGERLRHFISLLRFATGIGPKYSTAAKLKGIINVLTGEDKRHQADNSLTPIVNTFLSEIPEIIGPNHNDRHVQLVIVGYDYFKKRVNFFRSRVRGAATPFSSQYFNVTLGEAIHASSTAPVNYFDDPARLKLTGKDTRTNWYWDGGVSGFNNPVLAGLIEAITNGTKPDDCRVLSVGTGSGQRAIITDFCSSSDAKLRAIFHANVTNTLVITDHKAVFLRDVKELATSILADPPDSDTFMAYAVMHPDLRSEANIVRINPILLPELDKETNLYKCPAVYNIDATTRKNFQTLLDMDMDAVKQTEVDLISDLCDKYIVTDPEKTALPNQLIRGSLDTAYLGYAFYLDGKSRWKDIE
jgi:uncharacterized protein